MRRRKGPAEDHGGERRRAGGERRLAGAGLGELGVDLHEGPSDDLLQIEREAGILHDEPRQVVADEERRILPSMAVEHLHQCSRDQSQV